MTLAQVRWVGSPLRPMLARGLSRLAEGGSLQLAEPQKCSKCGTILKTFSFLCPRCEALGPKCRLYEVNPYDCFSSLQGQPMSFKLNEQKLASEYRDLVKQLHPDRLQGAGASADEVELATEHSALLRQAFNQLSDPVARAVALLKWAYDTDVLGEDSEIEDNIFLMDIIEATEEATQPHLSGERARELQQEWSEALEVILNDIGGLFQALEQSTSAKIEDAVSIRRVDQLDGDLQKCRVIQNLLALLEDKLISHVQTSS